MDPGALLLSSDTSYYSNDGEEWTEFYYDSPIWTDCSNSGSSSSCYNGELRGDVSYRNGHFIAAGKAFITPKTVLNGQTPGTTEVMMLLHSVGSHGCSIPGR